MNWASSEVIGILIFLLPGFVTASIFYWLTSHPKPNVFDRVIQALIFTVIGRAITDVLQELLISVCKMEENSLLIKNEAYVLSVLVAVALALPFAYFSNNDTVHSILRYFRVTKETAYPSEWYSAFSRHPDCYVVLHLKGQRRLYGWPEEWPSRPDEGHFRIAEGEWLEEDKRTPAKGVSAILIPVGEVEMVEFLNNNPEETRE